MTQSRGVVPDAGDPVPSRPAPPRPEQVPPSSQPDFDWSRFGLEQIWQMVDRQSPHNAYSAGAMWANMRALCSSEADKLETALQQLAEHWTPTQEAAALFQEWGGKLVRAMRQTSETAGVNGPIVYSISREVELAKGRLAELMEQKAVYERREAEHGRLWVEAEDMVRDWFGDGPFGSWRSDLDQQAREIMLHLERQIASHGDAITWDPHYEPNLIPPVELPKTREDDPGWGGGGLPGSLWGAPQMRIPGPDAELGGWTPPGLGDGPESADPPLDGETVLGGGPSSGAGSLPAAAGGVFVDTPAGRALAPGGVIGAPAGGGFGTVPGGPGGSPGSGAGGIGTGGGVAGRPGGPGMVPFVPPVAGQSGTRGAGGSPGRRARRGLPSVFEAPQGPSAVIRPPEEPEAHDPGPGVIGIDR